jgi:hypothetical protein
MYFDDETREESRRQEEYNKKAYQQKMEIAMKWKYTICDCCHQIDCICGCKEVQMNDDCE